MACPRPDVRGSAHGPDGSLREDDDPARGLLKLGTRLNGPPPNLSAASVQVRRPYWATRSALKRILEANRGQLSSRP